MKNLRPIEMRSLVLVYGGLVFISLVADFLWRGHPFWAWKVSRLPTGILILSSLGVIVVYILISLICRRYTHWAAELENVLRQLLTPLSYFHIILLAVLSGFVEEWFFRGILQNHFGVVVSALIFGLAHLIPTKPLWIWSVWCFVAGIIFGIIYKESGSLFLVCFIHASINGILLYLLNMGPYKPPNLS